MSRAVHTVPTHAGVPRDRQVRDTSAPRCRTKRARSAAFQVRRTSRASGSSLSGRVCRGCSGEEMFMPVRLRCSSGSAFTWPLRHECRRQARFHCPRRKCWCPGGRNGAARLSAHRHRAGRRIGPLSEPTDTSDNEALSRAAPAIFCTMVLPRRRLPWPEPTARDTGRATSSIGRSQNCEVSPECMLAAISKFITSPVWFLTMNRTPATVFFTASAAATHLVGRRRMKICPAKRHRACRARHSRHASARGRNHRRNQRDLALRPARTAQDEARSRIEPDESA